MGYPGSSDVQHEAETFGFDQLVVFAYATYHSSVPTGGDGYTVLSNWKNQIDGQAAGWGIDARLLYGYIQQYGTIPSNASQVTSWAHGENYLDSAGNLQQAPQPGHNYPGSAASSTTTTTAPPPSNPLGGLTTPINIMGVQVSPLAIGGVAMVGGLLLFSGGGRRR